MQYGIILYIMDDVDYIDRRSGSVCREKIYGRWALSLLYGSSTGSRIFSFFFLPLFAKISWFSSWYGALQRKEESRKKIEPFIQAFDIDVSEFAEPVSSFQSFDAFFTRKLKPESRPIDPRADRIVMPADGRYLVFENIERTDSFYAKGQKFDLASFLQDDALARRFEGGSMAIVRLCPSDYHRFHFPCDGIPSSAKPIEGDLYSVNPMALRKRFSILSENKRVLTELETRNCGRIAIVEIGAACVGAIHQTYAPGRLAQKGEEKGYFSFGGSCIVLLFEPMRVRFDEDLLRASRRCLETKGSMGESLAQIGQASF